MGALKAAKEVDTDKSQPLPDDSSIHIYIYVFWTLEKEKSNEINVIHNTSIRSATENPEYESAVNDDLSQHEVWSDCTYEEGDLRTWETIYACDKCLDSHYYNCLLKEETGG